jgi:hypothetical protein
MKSGDLGQVVVSPDDVTDELMLAINKALESGRELKVSRRTTVRLYLADALHPLGIHHWVHYRTFDPSSNRIIVHPNVWVCALCPKGKRG